MSLLVKSFLCSLPLLSFNLYASSDLKECDERQCQAVIDAGSSGTRLYIYAKDEQSSSWQQIWNQKINPGLSSVEESAVGDYLDKLMQVAPNKPMFISFYGTAGMRLLSPEEQQKRYEAASLWFKSHPEWRLEHIRTISGQEEGVFAWIAVQSEMHVLNQPMENLKSVIEVGGASAQVTIPVSEQELGHYSAADIYKINLKDKPLYVWSKSFLGLGMTEVEKQFINSSSCYSQGYPLKDTIIGHGDARQCIQELETSTGFPIVHIFEPAKEVVIQHPKLNWVALGALRYSMEVSPFSFTDHLFTFKDMRQLGDDQFCHQSWEQLSQSATVFPFIYRQCFSISYFYSAFVDAMGINEQESIYFPEHDAQMDWTLGTLLLTDGVENRNTYANAN